MGNSQSNINSIIKIGYEDVQESIKNNECLLINTLKKEEQHCLISNTVNVEKEEEIINNLVHNSLLQKKIIIYGKNATDDSVFNTYNKLKGLGFYNLYIYIGGLFEWLLLQDIYSEEFFPTSSKITDILKYKGERKMNLLLLQ